MLHLSRMWCQKQPGGNVTARFWFVFSPYTPVADVTRVLLLDEEQGRALSQTIAHLLKDIGQELATENFLVGGCVWVGGCECEWV